MTCLVSLGIYFPGSEEAFAKGLVPAFPEQKVIFKKNHIEVTVYPTFSAAERGQDLIARYSHILQSLSPVPITSSSVYP